MGRKLIDLTGQVFSRWSVISYYGKARSGPHYWNCICSCGMEKDRDHNASLNILRLGLKSPG